MTKLEHSSDNFQKFPRFRRNSYKNNLYAKYPSHISCTMEYSADRNTNGQIPYWSVSPTEKSDQINVLVMRTCGSSKLSPTQGNQPTSEGKNEKICEVLEALRDLVLNQNQAEEQCMRPDITSVEDAIYVVNFWPNDIQAPTVDIDEEGYVSLYIFDEDEVSRAGIEFFSKDHMATYAILHDNRKDAECGYLDTQTEVIKFFEQYRKHWME